ncbi:hypothetical protein MD484_g5658, partial [Candolleomyces efflorescens]
MSGECTPVDVPINYQDPTLTLPVAPPKGFCEDDEDCECDACKSLYEWYEQFKQTFDDILLRSNVHKCYGKRDDSQKGEGANPLPNEPGNAKKRHATGKGCINRHGVCTARFPRETHQESKVDDATGYIHLKKREPWINNVTPSLTFACRCNTDSTCLQSGTGISAIIGYISDYLTKFPLKTYQVFSTMFDVFTKNLESEGEENAVNGARKMILRIVNALSVKMEIGAPMAALYLLGLPDHYSSHTFQVFYWKNFVNFVEREWENFMARAEAHGLPDMKAVIDIPDGVDFLDESDHADAHGEDAPDADDNVQLSRTGGNFISKASTDDYRKDKGDREYYCMTMLTLFKPWRTGIDLKASHDSWDTAFRRHTFSPREEQLMSNFNIRYECYDARDDFAATYRVNKDGPKASSDHVDEREGMDCDDKPSNFKISRVDHQSADGKRAWGIETASSSDRSQFGQLRLEKDRQARKD